jgi:hypothetical protein
MLVSFYLNRDYSSGVEHSPRNPRVKGLSLTTADNFRNAEIAKKVEKQNVFVFI